MNRRLAPLVLVWILAPLLLCVPLAWGAWSGHAGFCTAVAQVSDTTLTCTLDTGHFEAGHAAIVWAATDNVATTDGETTLHSSITDSKSNVYTKACEFTNGQGAAAAGATVSVWFSKLATQLNGSTDSITLTTASAVTAKAIFAAEFAIGVGSVISLVGTCQTLANDNADAGSQTISGLASQEYLFVRGIATESRQATSMTATSGYALFGIDGCENTAGGTGASNIGACGETRILTGTGDTSDPTLADTTNDNASVFVALKEAAPAAPTGQRKPIIIGLNPREYEYQECKEGLCR